LSVSSPTYSLHSLLEVGRSTSNYAEGGLGTNKAAVDEEDITEYLRSHTEELDLAGECEESRGDLVQYG
jgi:hypothetical protein